MNERYKILKELYPNYLILIKDKEKYKSKDIILNVFNEKELINVNKLILDNLDIESITSYENNEYSLFYIKAKLIMILESFRKDMMK